MSASSIEPLLSLHNPHHSMKHINRSSWSWGTCSWSWHFPRPRTKWRDRLWFPCDRKTEWPTSSCKTSWKASTRSSSSQTWSLLAGNSHPLHLKLVGAKMDSGRDISGSWACQREEAWLLFAGQGSSLNHQIKWSVWLANSGSGSVESWKEIEILPDLSWSLELFDLER